MRVDGLADDIVEQRSVLPVLPRGRFFLIPVPGTPYRRFRILPFTANNRRKKTNRLTLIIPFTAKKMFAFTAKIFTTGFVFFPFAPEKINVCFLSSP